MLKPGGRIVISDIVATAPLPEELRSDFAGCVSGASTVTEIEQALRDAGFTGIEVLIKESSRQFINDWVPGKNAGDFVTSATIQARKP